MEKKAVTALEMWSTALLRLASLVVVNQTASRDFSLSPRSKRPTVGAWSKARLAKRASVMVLVYAAIAFRVSDLGLG
jgi:hypothetical protein